MPETIHDQFDRSQPLLADGGLAYVALMTPGPDGAEPLVSNPEEVRAAKAALMEKIDKDPSLVTQLQRATLEEARQLLNAA